MPNDVTVPVTVEQLKSIEWKEDIDGWKNWCPACDRSSGDDHKPDCWIAASLSAAERLRDWKPKAGDRVRLKSMPDRVAFIDGTGNGGAGRVWILFDDGVPALRYLAELMPEDVNGE